MHTSKYTVNKTFVAIIFAILTSVFFLSAAVDTAKAQTIPAWFTSDIGLIGYAWSSNVGWISMSCKNKGSCGSVPYGVFINPTGNLEGYAWNSHVGYIRFDGLGGTPAAAGNTSGPAVIEGLFPEWNFAGWSRFCSATNNPNCTGGVKPNAAGWDGWLSLKGSAPYGIKFSPMGTVEPTSFAWGSTVVGWVRFGSHDEAVRLDPDTAPPGFPGPAASLVVSPEDVSFPGSVDLTTSGGSGASICFASNDRGIATWNGPLSATTPLTTTINPPLGTTNLTLNCYDGFGRVDSQTVPVASKQNVVVSAFSMSDPGVPRADGTYAIVDFNLNIDGLLDGDSVPYSLILDASGSGGPTLSLTGTVSNSGGTASIPGTNTISPALRFTDVPVGVFDVDLEVDMAPAPGVIIEDLVSTPTINEDIVDNVNTSVTTATLYPGAVAITLTPSTGPAVSVTPPTTPSFPTPPGYSPFAATGPLGSGLVRFANEYQFDLTLTPPVDVECSVTGPGTSVTAPIIPGGTTQSVTLPSAPVTALSEFIIQCAVPATSPLAPLILNDHTFTVEVIPQSQEI